MLSLTLSVQIASEWEQYVLGLGASRCESTGRRGRTLDFNFQALGLLPLRGDAASHEILVADTREPHLSLWSCLTK